MMGRYEDNEDDVRNRRRRHVNNQVDADAAG